MAKRSLIQAMREEPYFQRRAFRQRRRNDAARKEARLHRYYTRIIGMDIPDEWTHLPDPRNCSCFICRGGYIERNAARERRNPKVNWDDQDV